MKNCGERIWSWNLWNEGVWTVVLNEVGYKNYSKMLNELSIKIPDIRYIDFLYTEWLQ